MRYTISAELNEKDKAIVGQDKVDAAAQNYFNNWKFRHPDPEDIRKAFEEAIGGSLSKFFELTKKEGKLE